MTLADILVTSASVLASLGGGAVIIFLFAKYLGDLWAKRLIQDEKSSLDRELENHKAILNKQIEESKASLNQELEKTKASLNEDLEGLRVRLKKSEFLFEREYEAASKFVAYYQGLLPTYNSPHMDSDAANNEFAYRLDDIEKWLISYLSNHGAILSPKVITLIGKCRSLAGEFKFEGGSIEQEPSREANKAAEEVWGILQEIEKALIQTVKGQAT